jgi:hypothetical protein
MDQDQQSRNEDEVADAEHVPDRPRSGHRKDITEREEVWMRNRRRVREPM